MLDSNAPFVVANDPRRFVVQAAAGAVLVVVMVVLVTVTGGAAVPLIGLGAGIALVLVSLLSLRHRDPVMIADGDGVVLRAFKGPAGVRRLGWDQVEALYVHKISRQFRMLCVRPRDIDAERAWAGEKRAQVIDGSVKRVGAPYSVNLVAAGLSDDEALDTLRALAAGRATVGERPGA